MSSIRLLTDEVDARSYVAGMADEDGMRRLELYAELLLAENQQQNLISKASEEQIWKRHLADGAQLLEYVSRETQPSMDAGPWLDLGTGPGLPGLVIAALRPQMPVVLVESRSRRVEFLNHCVEQLGLTECRVEGDRLERLTPFKACVISARAFAPLEKLLRLSAPFSTKTTRYLLPKGRSAAHELQQLKPSIRSMFHVEQSLTDPDAGIIVSS